MLSSVSSLLQRALFRGNAGAVRVPVPSPCEDGRHDSPQLPPLRLTQAPLYQHRLWYDGAVDAIGRQAVIVPVDSEVDDDGEGDYDRSFDFDDNDAWDIFASINWDIGGVDEDISSDDGSYASDDAPPVVVADVLAMSNQPRKNTMLDWLRMGEFESYALAKGSVAPSSTQSTKTIRCTVCLGPGVHDMCTRYMKCTCRGHCTKQLRVFTYSMSKRSVMYKWGQYGDFGITTKQLRNEPRPSTFIFHWDATYKINSMAYPVLICGMTDPGGRFHPVAFFVIVEESTDEYEWAMRELMKVYEPLWVVH
ncbi:hypothetical protein DYB37_011602 [Aphanomyces astaci]|uniref:MULE transposase domain-containing protein n=1 Tax=Aphanomyces astaci TaxID=112090 RepID=A0A3L6VGD9_APHAT|nr:hypothetical protein DYB35_011702 [Aphanomyces astaci]RHZ29809.1 hypothetical protein DYB37_011602 [Aphanomyces astaci]RLO07892.1 hypothetical protein DYB28_001559 [Aphanomyces astaci]